MALPNSSEWLYLHLTNLCETSDSEWSPSHQWWSPIRPHTTPKCPGPLPGLTAHCSPSSWPIPPSINKWCNNNGPVQSTPNHRNRHRDAVPCQRAETTTISSYQAWRKCNLVSTFCNENFKIQQKNNSTKFKPSFQLKLRRWRNKPIECESLKRRSERDALQTAHQLILELVAFR